MFRRFASAQVSAPCPQGARLKAAPTQNIGNQDPPTGTRDLSASWAQEALPWKSLAYGIRQARSEFSLSAENAVGRKKGGSRRVLQKGETFGGTLLRGALQTTCYCHTAGPSSRRSNLRSKRATGLGKSVAPQYILLRS